MTVVAIHQPNYLPWLGYFRKLAKSDVFVFFDNVQMPIGKSYVSRCRIKTGSGPTWLTVPTVRNSAGALIADTPIVAGNWQRKHLRTLQIAYARSHWLSDILDMLGETLAESHASIADLNIKLIVCLADYLEMRPVFVRATELGLPQTGAASIEEILRITDATTYLTGKGAGTMRYLDVDALKKVGIATEFVSTDFSEYTQRHGNFVHGLSILDPLLNCGPEVTRSLIY